MHFTRVGNICAALLLVIVGIFLIGAGATPAAQAAPANLGSGPGLSFTPASGATTLPGKDVTYSSPACPASFSGSAVVSAVNTDGTTYAISVPDNQVSSAFSGTLTPGITMAGVRDTGNAGLGGTQELVVQCFSGLNGSGTMQNFVDAVITWSLDGLSWDIAQIACPPNTSTYPSLVASPNPAQPGQQVTLTAQVTGPCTGSVPTGTVSFESNGTIIGSPVTLGVSGTASTTTTFTATGAQSLTVVFTGTPHLWSDSTSQPLVEQVIQPGALPPAASESVQVTVPPTGTFSIALANLGNPVVLTGSVPTATGNMNQLQVTDTRNTFPGWSVTGQVTDFTAPGSVPPGDIPGSDLGWTPTGTVQGGAVLGPQVTICIPGCPGLGTAAVLAYAPLGSGPGTSTLGAFLVLFVPPTAPSGSYSATLTLTAVPVHL